MDAISLLLCLLSAAVFIQLQLRAGTRFILFGVAAGLIVLGLIWVYFQYRRRRIFIPYSRILTVAAIAWFAVPSIPWVGALVLLLALLERPAKLPLEIGFSDDRIVFNTLFKRRFQWQDFNNIVLKDGLLTLDFKNNKLFQKQTVDDDEDDADEDEFNAYCRLRLKGR